MEVQRCRVITTPGFFRGRLPYIVYSNVARTYPETIGGPYFVFGSCHRLCSALACINIARFSTAQRTGTELQEVAKIHDGSSGIAVAARWSGSVQPLEFLGLCMLGRPSVHQCARSRSDQQAMQAGFS